MYEIGLRMLGEELRIWNLDIFVYLINMEYLFIWILGKVIEVRFRIRVE